MVADANNLNESQRTILVVDDFDDTRLLLRTWLQRKGFRVVEAENGNRAVATAEREHPDLIIMDVEMPELDGLAATRKIRGLAEFEGVPILAVWLRRRSISRSRTRSRLQRVCLYSF